MFNVGGWEFLVILVLALLVLGPDKLPEAARQFGKYSGQLREMARGFQKEFDAVKSEFVELSDLSEAQARANGAAAVRDDKPGPRGNLHKFEDSAPDGSDPFANGSSSASLSAAAEGSRASDDEAQEKAKDDDRTPRPGFDAASARPDRSEKPVAEIPRSESASADVADSADSPVSEAAPVERPKLDGTEMI